MDVARGGLQWGLLESLDHWLALHIAITADWSGSAIRGYWAQPQSGITGNVSRALALLHEHEKQPVLSKCHTPPGNARCDAAHEFT